LLLACRICTLKNHLGWRFLVTCFTRPRTYFLLLFAVPATGTLPPAATPLGLAKDDVSTSMTLCAVFFACASGGGRNSLPTPFHEGLRDSGSGGFGAALEVVVVVVVGTAGLGLGLGTVAALLRSTTCGAGAGEAGLTLRRA